MSPPLFFLSPLPDPSLSVSTDPHFSHGSFLAHSHSVGGVTGKKGTCDKCTCRTCGDSVAEAVAEYTRNITFKIRVYLEEALL